jgi:predicted nucleotidyltransferase
MSPRIPIDQARIAEFCKKWSVTEFALFGSVLRDGFRSDSDIDVMLTYGPDAEWTLFDMARMRDELVKLFGHDVDLLTRPAVEMSANYMRRKSILESATVVYAA